MQSNTNQMNQKSAVEVCRQFSLGDVAKKLLNDQLTAEQYVQVLIQNKQYVDAVRVLAYALPTRQAIVWARLCAGYYSDANPSNASLKALDAVDQWLSESDDDKRRATMDAAKGAGFDTPAGSAALAVFFSGGSLGPPDVPIIPPQDYLTPNSVCGTVLLATLLHESEKSEEKYRVFLAEGLKIAAHPG